MMNASWTDLVGSALLGTDRRRPPASGGPHPALDPATELLDAAAIGTVSRRAGLRPAAARERPAPAAPDRRPVLPEAARRRLGLLLADRSAGGGSSGRRGTAPNLAELLPQWLAAAGRYGYAAPPALLPDLLDAARARTDLRADALALAGPRALWLAELNPEWRFALRAGVRGLEPAAGDPAAIRQLWDEGLFAERVALLTRLRGQDASAALALLRSTWTGERAEDRLMFLDSLRAGLSPADEPFLEQALTDRSRNVRATAAELLSALPGSALAARMAERARSCVSLGTGENVAGIGILVEAPYECDAAMERDGVAPHPPTGRGERAWWFGQLVEAAPLATWTARFGGRDPEEIIALPVADDWQPDLHAAWCRAAVRQRDPAWARALLGPPPAPASPVAAVGDPAKLLSILPEEERAEWVARFIATHGLSEAFQMLGVCAVPWAGPLGRAVVDALDIARDAGSYPWSFSGVMGLAERCLDPAEAERLTVLTAATEEPDDGSPGAGSYWAEAFQRLVGTLRLRAVMLAELEPPAPAAPAS
ncbi:hypothetical protein G3I60_39030 [Streptomyces sp. SID13666]|uniref:DUF5691 domain-containing protein n=1 Tax=unclassified Streptomyces TaxID=2593676 RepID=UPI0013C1448B|nr:MULTISPECIES: DUF5691 domain-containing protein [unclassified Streptomyces]NEA59996.1 hypothetical protein [Streptomyces sp. SID13666]NEA73020.1 hypothetical protein [Streptomyces sp. SID13588]